MLPRGGTANYRDVIIEAITGGADVEGFQTFLRTQAQAGGVGHFRVETGVFGVNLGFWRRNNIIPTEWYQVDNEEDAQIDVFLAE